MGINDSPYHEFQSVIWAKELALGNKQDKINPFKWERVVNNLLGTPIYDCCRQWVYKERSDWIITADMFVYVDEGQPIGSIEEVCW